jgi:hypothetical protein
MRWWPVCLWGLSLVGVLGNRAVQKDIEEWRRLGKCPPEEEVEELCEALGDPDCFPECQD